MSQANSEFLGNETCDFLVVTPLSESHNDGSRIGCRRPALGSKAARLKLRACSHHCGDEFYRTTSIRSVALAHPR